MTDLVAITVLAVVLGFAAWYVYKAKKSGTKCIGCPAEGSCSGKCSCQKGM